MKGAPDRHMQLHAKRTNHAIRTDEYVLEAEERRALLPLPMLLPLQRHRLKVRARHFLLCIGPAASPAFHGVGQRGREGLFVVSC